MTIVIAVGKYVNGRLIFTKVLDSARNKQTPL